MTKAPRQLNIKGEYQHDNWDNEFAARHSKHTAHQTDEDAGYEGNPHLEHPQRGKP